jgi:hypothetical protein
LIVLALPVSQRLRAAEMPAWLPRYEVDMDMDVAGHSVHVTMRATWTNPYTEPARELVFNAHSRYIVPDDQVGLTAKTLEILRMAPGESMGETEPALDIHRATLVNAAGPGKDEGLLMRYEGDTKTTLVVPLPYDVKPGQSATVVLDMTMRLPQKQGRWGQWREVTFLSNWLPVFAVFGKAPPPRTAPHEDEKKHVITTYDPLWQPTPFIAWHQPFFNEAAIYRVRVSLPSDQNVACTGVIVAKRELEGGRRVIEIRADGVRDFAFLCSARYKQFDGEAEVAPGRTVPVHVLAFEEHEHYAREMVRIAAEAITAYSRWFGPYAYPEFTIAEAFFGWNGNECGALVMIDERIFDMPHIACGFVDQLVSHETCHQWWYNAVGTNGYCETWMDEGLATYFAHRLQDQKHGHNNLLLNFPTGLEWLPNIRRDDYRTYAFYGTLGRGENGPTVRPIPEFNHVVNLFAMCYDKGSRIVGMIEGRLGEAAFLSFMRRVQERYRYRILRVADFQRELEEFTGQSWEQFFQDWLYGNGLSDWAVDKVKVTPECGARSAELCRVRRFPFGPARSYRVVVDLCQKAEYDEETVLGIAVPSCDGYSIRIPILPQATHYRIEDPPATVTVQPSQDSVCPVTGRKLRSACRVRVEVELPEEPTQIAVDPDQLLVDKDPANNFWVMPIRWRFTPLYTFLEETDLTTSYDRWNFIFGPWINISAYNDPWYQRTTVLGLRAGAYRTQTFEGGAYAVYRPNFKDVVIGVDGLCDHWPSSHVQLGFNAERRLLEQESGDPNASRAVVYGRYVLDYGDSLYLPPMHFVEAFATYTDNFLPDTQVKMPGAERFNSIGALGIHYRIDYLTPYWNPEGGFRVDAVYENGVVDLVREHYLQLASIDGSFVKSAPDLTGSLGAAVPKLEPLLRWFSDTRFAFHFYGGMAVPTRGEFFSLGGANLFRGFDLNKRQGSAVWVTSAEWRVPLMTGLHCDAFDHVAGLRGIYGAMFCDIGDAYVRNHSFGPVAYAVGGGLRFDVTWFSFVERTLLRVDMAKTVNENTGLQVWFDVQVPF